jgi:hypothetical protein
MAGWSSAWRAVLVGGALLLTAPAAQAASTGCLGDAPVALGDWAAITTVRGAVDASCPCADFDGSADHDRRAYKRCARTVVKTLVNAGTLRAECSSKVRRFNVKSTCGYARSRGAEVCAHDALATGAVSCSIALPGSACRDTAGVDDATRCSAFTHCIDAVDTNGDLRIAAPGDSGGCAPTPTPQPVSTPAPYATGSLGKQLFDLVNQYRVKNGKRAHPYSPTMGITAAAHVSDLALHPEIDSGQCIPHSWSKFGGSLWTGCCYTIDAAQADCMWSKPRQLSAGLGMINYTGNGYEIALRGFAGITAQQVLEAFVNSPPHRDVLLSTGGWSFLDTHPAMGAAIEGKYGVVWFGDASDSN